MRRSSRIRRMVRMLRRRIRKTETAWRKLCRFLCFSAPIHWGIRVASAIRPVRAAVFSLNLSRGIRRLRTAGTCADAARAHKRDGHQGFHPSYESPRFLLASACQRTETIRVRQRIFTSVSFSTDSQCRINYCYTCGLINAGAT